MWYFSTCIHHEIFKSGWNISIFSNIYHLFVVEHPKSSSSFLKCIVWYIVFICSHPTMQHYLFILFYNIWGFPMCQTPGTEVNKSLLLPIHISAKIQTCKQISTLDRPPVQNWLCIPSQWGEIYERPGNHWIHIFAGLWAADGLEKI